eukprot:GFKZ01008635.1.p1 GENE.GFKZ01008635.1~~GFKZ01008635.1.p1  ORF type:complete len:335 (-),score=45.71 GFKZ01008635.1:952-1956(-)
MPFPAFTTSCPLPFQLHPPRLLHHHHHHPPFQPSPPRSPRRLRFLPRMQTPTTPPDYTSGFTPETSSNYDEVRVLSFGPTRHEGSLLTLRPVAGGDRAFKMSVTTAQADSIRAALRSKCPEAMTCRPATHDLFKKVMDLFGGFVTKAAITHIQDEVFIARVWIRGGMMVSQDEVHIDSRPSDAIAMALRSRAPIYLHKGLLKAWNVSVESVCNDARNGLCECVLDYPDEVKSTTSIVHEIKGSPEHLTLAKLRMELDLAVRLERFREATVLKDRIAEICPIDRLSEMLKVAIDEERYLDAAKLQDQITLWKARLRMWEKGSIDLENFSEDTQDS